MKALIGHTGFVGSNIASQANFEKCYNSKNIHEIENSKFDLVVCAGVSAVKWYANKHPEEDLERINSLIAHLKTVKAKRFVLISTIDVYEDPVGVTEDTFPIVEQQDAYGQNRYYLEKWVASYFDTHHIIRLPALFGTGLKKNFIYDMLTIIPSIIVPQKWEELRVNMPEHLFQTLSSAYTVGTNDNFVFDQSIDTQKRKEIKSGLEAYGFTSLNFTDNRSVFPYYDMKNIWKDIEKTIEENLSLINLSVEPLSCDLVAKEVFNKTFSNQLTSKTPLYYDMKSKHAHLWGGEEGYLYSKAQTLEGLKVYVQSCSE